MMENIMWQITATLSIFLAVSNFIDLERVRKTRINDAEQGFASIIYYAIMSNIFLSIAIHALQKVFCGC